jgi:hypothetical protein
VETYNCLSDFVGSQDLIILRLGYLGYPNKAAPGITKQALGIREVALKPTWIVEEPSSIFGPGHYTYSEDLEEYIGQHFEVVDLRSSCASDTEAPHGVGVASQEIDASGDVGFGPPSPMPEERIQTEPVEEDDTSHYQAMRKKSGRKSQWGKKQYKGPGGQGGAY